MAKQTKTETKSQTKIPKNEILWVTHYDSRGSPRFFVTSSADRERYYIYEVESNGGLSKLGSGQSPLQLEQKYVK